MCINPRLHLNPKYLPNNKNGGNPPVLLDDRVKYVPIGCGVCYECLKKKSNSWKVRLFEEVKDEKDWSFVTFTFSPDSLEYLRNKVNEDYWKEYGKVVDVKTGEVKGNIPDIHKSTDDNAVATYAIRKFLERWRKLTGKSVKHFFVTEKGHKGTHRIHLHGIIKSRDFDFIENRWGYGWIFPGDETNRKNNYVNNKSINYISKYITKVDMVNKGFFGKILCSPGIGKKYTESINFQYHKFEEKLTKDHYINYRGGKMCLPIYYRNYAYTESEREKLWIYKIEEQVRYVFGERINISTLDGMNNYYNTLMYYRIINRKLGYITQDDWEYSKYHDRNIKVNNIEAFDNS